jgi:hypothetical protein
MAGEIAGYAHYTIDMGPEPVVIVGLLANEVVDVEVETREGWRPCVTGQNGFFFLGQDLAWNDLLAIRLRFTSGGSSITEFDHNEDRGR